MADPALNHEDRAWLPSDGWKPGARIRRIEAEVFGEK